MRGCERMRMRRMSKTEARGPWHREAESKARRHVTWLTRRHVQRTPQRASIHAPDRGKEARVDLSQGCQPQGSGALPPQCGPVVRIHWWNTSPRARRLAAHPRPRPLGLPAQPPRPVCTRTAGICAPGRHVCRAAGRGLRSRCAASGLSRASALHPCDGCAPYTGAALEGGRRGRPQRSRHHRPSHHRSLGGCRCGGGGARGCRCQRPQPMAAPAHARQVHPNRPPRAAAHPPDRPCGPRAAPRSQNAPSRAREICLPPPLLRPFHAPPRRPRLIPGQLRSPRAPRSRSGRRVLWRTAAERCGRARHGEAVPTAAGTPPRQIPHVLKFALCCGR